MRRACLATAFALAAALPGPVASCHRRLRDLVPPGPDRSDIETTLLAIIENLEDCVERSRGSDQTRREVLGRILAKWSSLYEAAKSAAPPETIEVSPEEYRLVLDSVEHYARRVREAWDAGDRDEAVRQEIALQHVVAELYGANPGQISNARAVQYTTTTYDHLPPLAPDNLEAWRARTRLLQIRLERWCQEIGDNSQHLGSLRLLRAAVSGFLDRLEPLESDEGDSTTPSLALDEEAATAIAKDLAGLAKRAPGAVLRASWSRSGVPKDLQVVPTREKYPTLDRPPGS